MKRFWGVSMAVVLAATLVPASALAAGKKSRPGPGQAASQPRPGQAASRPVAAPDRVPGEIIVRYKASAGRAAKKELRREVGAAAVEALALNRTEVVEVAAGSVADAIAALESSPDVAYAEPNFIYRTSATPNDPRFAQEWGLHNTGQAILGGTGTADADIDAPEAWQHYTGSSDVTVAIIDTGVAYDHPDLAANMWTNPGESGSGKEANGIDDDRNGLVDDSRGWDFVDDDKNPSDLFSHGTHVAGTVGASGNDGYGITGVVWDVQLMPLRVLGNDGAGTTADVASAISYAAAKGADVINLSLGGPDFSLSVANAISAASDSLIVAAAGNEGANVDVTASYPCNYASANVVCVGATDSNDNLAGYSNYGAINVDLAAPGSRVLSTVPGFSRPLRETFEAGLGAWVTGGRGTPWSLALDSFGYYATDSAGAPYQSNSDSWMATAAPTSLAGKKSCALTYSFSLATENGPDGLSIEASTDGTTWTKLGGWTGSTGGDWLSGSHDLGAYDDASVYVRFRLTSNALINHDGASVDDIEIRCLNVNYSGTEYAYLSGTSMATPHVAGAAALLFAAAPQASVGDVRSALLEGTDGLDALLGKAATGGRLNVAKSLGIVVPSAAPMPETDPLPVVGEEEPTPEPSPTAEPDPTPTPEPEPTPEPLPTTLEPQDPPATVDHDRRVRFKLRGHLRAKGRLVVADGVAECLNNVTLKIKRNGRLLKKVTTDVSGAFLTKLRDRKGRYVVVAPAFDIHEGRCTKAASPKRRHRHS